MSYQCDICKKWIESQVVIECSCGTKYCKQCLDKLMEGHSCRESVALGYARLEP